MMTPDCLRQLYNFTDYTPQATSNNSIAIGEQKEPLHRDGRP